MGEIIVVGLTLNILQSIQLNESFQSFWNWLRLMQSLLMFQLLHFHIKGKLYIGMKWDKVHQNTLLVL